MPEPSPSLLSCSKADLDKVRVFTRPEALLLLVLAPAQCSLYHVS